VTNSSPPEFPPRFGALIFRLLLRKTPLNPSGACHAQRATIFEQNLSNPYRADCRALFSFDFFVGAKGNFGVQSLDYSEGCHATPAALRRAIPLHFLLR
jgi:hypothetical protein